MMKDDKRTKPAILAFRIAAAAQDEDDLCAALWDLDTRGVQVTSGPDETVVLLAYFDPPMAVETLRVRLSPLAREVDTADIREVDWVARFRESFAGFDVAGFHVVPAWDTETTRGPRTLVIDPGRAFGTGTHESTSLCLEALTALAAERPLGKVLDLGTGTGILAAAAVRLGATLAVATDIDGDAALSARHHGRLNDVPLHVVQADGAAALRPGFDVVLANLTAPLLVERHVEITGLLAPSGRLVVAGFLEGDVGPVAAAFSDLREVRQAARGEWRCLAFAR